MSPRKGRHPRRKGPGGPRRASRLGDNVIPISHAPGARRRDGLLDPTVDRLVRTLLSTVQAMAPAGATEGRALAIELWADRLAATTYRSGDMPAEFYADLAGGLLSSADPDAVPVLAALALVVDHDEADPLRLSLAEHRERTGPDDPSDLGIGRAQPRTAHEISHVQGDGVTLMVDVDQPGTPHCIGVFVDHNLGGLAKDLLVGPSWAELERDGAYEAEPGIEVREISLADARARIEEALHLTGHTVDPPVSDDFEDTRALVERRVADLPEGGEVPTWSPLEEEQVEELVDAFLDSPEAATLRPGERDQAGWLIELWLDHATGYTVGGPHRLSPVMVEVFCVDWYPRKALADPETAAAAPAVLTAWAHHAARVSGLEDTWRDEAVEAIERFAPAMLGGVAPSGGGFGELDPDLRDALGRTVDSDPASHTGGTLGSLGDRADVPLEDATAWRPLQPGPPGPRRMEWRSDATGVRPEVETKVKVICVQCSAWAERLLGPAFVQPAIDLATRIGTLDPSPLPHTQDRSWTSAIVWLLAEDSDGFSREPGRTRDELAEDLPLGRSSVVRRVGQIRDLLDLEKGDLAVPW